MTITREAASFRDSAGHVFHCDGRILRTIAPSAADDFRVLHDSGLLASLEKRGWLIESREVSALTLNVDDAALVVEHPVLPFISYPYEWCFGALKAAALLTLDLHLAALDQDATLIDASAFNVQFRGARPLFIDLLSLRRYRDGEFWRAQSQFCANFLSPLLLSARGIAPNAWLRGSMEGIEATSVLAALPWYWKLRWTILSNLVLPTQLQKRLGGLGAEIRADHAIAKPFPKIAYVSMLQQLRGFIQGLRGKNLTTLWRDYEHHQSYSATAQNMRDRIVEEFSGRTRPAVLWDIGCNTGQFALLALRAGAKRAIGFDFDTGAVEIAFRRAQEAGADFLPLVLDATNPSPDQGWQQLERKGLKARRNADVLLAMAVLHHLVIGRNVPLADAVGWLVSLAPSGLIEFVPRGDPMVQRMIALRRDQIFSDYEEAAFAAHLSRHAQIVARHELSSGGRCVFEYRRL